MASENKELKNTTYEAFVGILSVLSILIIAFIYLARSDAVDSVVLLMNGFLSLIFLVDFTFRFVTAGKDKWRYLFLQFGWADLVLPSDTEQTLRDISAQVAHQAQVYERWGFGAKLSRGRGISALFSGPSGTGKTMAAEVLAGDLSLDLYRIDLSGVVSKYIGETEKNLRRVFDAAATGGAILFFDEADALFGKRSEVKDSHDRYANIEINYLLQRMEAYRGLAILATNMKSALDTAFLRRLRFIVRFPFPGVPERKAMWQKAFPADVPKGTLDYDRLARLNITGGHIHNIALNAAFLAAGAGTPVTMPLILDAARSEFRKIERPINEADFRWQDPAAGAVA